MKADYRLRLSGVLADAADVAFRAKVRELLDAATAAGLDVQADPIFFATKAAPVVMEAQLVKAPDAPAAEAPAKRAWRK